MASLTSIVCGLKLLQSVRQYLESVEIHNPKLARLLCQIIPNHCPFEREIKLGDGSAKRLPVRRRRRRHRIIFRIPPMCKLNPFYNQIVSLRFKCLCYLATV